MFMIKHICAIVGAVVIFAFAPLPDVWDTPNDGLYHLPKDDLPLMGGYYIPKIPPEKKKQHLDLLVSSFRDDNAITLFGSSELSDAGETMPYAYFPTVRGIPMVAYGSGHFDTFGAYMMMQGMHNSIKPNAKIVFILSPGWFADGHFLPHAFDANIGGTVARTVAYHGTPQGKQLLQSYVQRFSSQLNFEMAYGCWYGLCGGATGVKTLSGLFSGIYERSRQWRLLLLGDTKVGGDDIAPNYGLMKKEHDWDTYLPTMKQSVLSVQTNNAYGINDDYYDTYVRHARVGLPKPAFAKLDDYGWQLQSLSALLALLKEKQANAVFVMQPVNPLGYNDISKFYPIQDTVRSMIQGANFPYLDMYSHDVEKGILRDLFHVSPYGFSKINKFIEDTYYGQPSER